MEKNRLLSFSSLHAQLNLQLDGDDHIIYYRGVNRTEIKQEGMRTCVDSCL